MPLLADALKTRRKAGMTPFRTTPLLRLQKRAVTLRQDIGGCPKCNRTPSVPVSRLSAESLQRRSPKQNQRSPRPRMLSRLWT